MDNIKIGDFITEKQLQSGTIESDMIGKAYDLQYDVAESTSRNEHTFRVVAPGTAVSATPIAITNPSDDDFDGITLGSIVTETDLENGIVQSEMIGKAYDLEYRPATQDFLVIPHASGGSGGNVDLSNYYTKSEVDASQQAQNEDILKIEESLATVGGGSAKGDVDLVLTKTLIDPAAFTEIPSKLAAGDEDLTEAGQFKVPAAIQGGSKISITTDLSLKNEAGESISDVDYDVQIVNKTKGTTLYEHLEIMKNFQSFNIEIEASGVRLTPIDNFDTSGVANNIAPKVYKKGTNELVPGQMDILIDPLNTKNWKTDTVTSNLMPKVYAKGGIEGTLLRNQPDVLIDVVTGKSTIKVNEFEIKKPMTMKQFKEAYPIPSAAIPITNWNEFKAIDGTGAYVLLNDIDAGADTTFTGIPLLTGTFEGNGYEISNFTLSGANYLGLFNVVGSTTQTVAPRITNLGVIGSVISTGSACGLLAGEVRSASGFECVLENIWTKGSVDGINNIGGIVGSIPQKALINNWYSTATVTGNGGIGGAFGIANLTTPTDGYYAGDVTGTSQTGGVTGTSSNGQFKRVFSAGTVNGGAGSTGGIIGQTGYGGGCNRAFSIASVNGTGVNVNAILGFNNAGGVTESYAYENQLINGVLVTTATSGLATGIATSVQAHDPVIVENFFNPPATNYALEQAKAKRPISLEKFNTQFPKRKGKNRNLKTGRAVVPISTWAEFKAIPADTTDEYQLLNSIDALGDTTFTGIVHNFQGIFEGNGYVISNFTLNETTMYAGLFGAIDGVLGAGHGIVRNLGIEGAGNFTNATNSGLLSGLVHRGAIVENCFSIGTMTCTGSLNTGGLIGSLEDGNVYNSYSTVTITSNKEVCGGLVGRIGTTSGDNSIITNCYYAGDVTGIWFAGGLFGWCGTAASQVSNSFSLGSVTSTIAHSTGSFTGGLSGNVSGTKVSNCITLSDVTATNMVTVGALIGSTTGVITNSYCYENQLINGIPVTDATKGGATGIATSAQARDKGWWDSIVNAPTPVTVTGEVEAGDVLVLKIKGNNPDQYVDEDSRMVFDINPIEEEPIDAYTKDEIDAKNAEQDGKITANETKNAEQDSTISGLDTRVTDLEAAGGGASDVGTTELSMLGVTTLTDSSFMPVPLFPGRIPITPNNTAIIDINSTTPNIAVLKKAGTYVVRLNLTTQPSSSAGSIAVQIKHAGIPVDFPGSEIVSGGQVTFDATSFVTKPDDTATNLEFMLSSSVANISVPIKVQIEFVG